MYKLYNGDCLSIFKDIEDKSVNLVLIDPPYNIGKDKKWDKWKTVNEYVEFMGKVFKECQRVLKDNGSFYFFHNDFLQIVELQNYINNNTDFVFKQLLVWNKTNFKRFAWTNRNPDKCKDRNWFPNIEYCLYYTFQDETGLNRVQQDVDNYKPIKEYLYSKLMEKGLKYNDDRLIDLYIDNGIARNRASAKTILKHKLDKNYKQFEFITKKHYEVLSKVLDFDKSYEELRQEYEELRQEYEELREEYESLRYTFNLNEVQENISCVWTNKEINSGKKHSCQKPTDILEKIIKTSSNEGDIVLDCFMGSGSTGVACMNTNRKFIGIELDENYFNIAKDRIENSIKNK